MLATWREVLGERAWVMSREEAVKDGWFGPVGTAVSDAMAARIGDVVAACAGSWAVVCSKDEPLESSLIGMHGSLTAAEQLVPMLTPPPGDPATGSPRRLDDRAGLAGHWPASWSRPGELAGGRGRAPSRCSTCAGGSAGRPAASCTRPGTFPARSSSTWTGTWPPRPARGGRHPMPAAADFEAAMRRAGVRDGRPVVVYDDADSTAAARAWWLLRYFGHQPVRVLDGGLPGLDRGRPTRSSIRRARSGRSPRPADFTARPGQLGLLDADGAAALARDGLLLDARAGGAVPGRDRARRPGGGPHPRRGQRADGRQRQPGRHLPAGGRPGRPLRARSARPATVPVAAYCGSGVTAAHEVLALTLAGIPAALYVGSWSDWITDPARPVATGPSPG